MKEAKLMPAKMIPGRFPNRLRRIIYARGEAMRRVALEVGLDPQAMSRYCKGIHLPNLYLAHAIAAHLGVTMEEIWIVEDDEELEILRIECTQNAGTDASLPGETEAQT